MPLFLDSGFRGTREQHESCLVITPNSEHEAAHGTLLAIADSIAERPDADSAVRDALETLVNHYYAAPENWGLKHALQESFEAANRTLLTQGESGRACALTAIVLRRRRWALAHVGHTRAWLVRDNEIKVLTRDHVTPRMRRTPEVDRACGLYPDVEIDFLSGEVEEGDVFVLTNFAIHETVTAADILACVIAEVPAMQAASNVVAHAARNGADANVCVVRIEQVPEETREDLEEDVAALPAIAAPGVGDTIDGFRIERLVHKSSRFRLYKAVDTESDEVVALKFPNPRDADDSGFAERFLREEWIGRRVSSAHVVRTLPLKKGRRSALYSVMVYPSGESLAKRLARKGTLSLREIAFTGGQLLEALAQLHDQGVIHSDVRPQNILLEGKGRNVMLLGLGSSHVTHTSASEEGTTSASSSRRGTFLAPELFEPNVEPGVRSDVYAAGITLYRMLTGSYPYGKMTASGWRPHGDYVSALHYREDIPTAVDAVLERACALDPTERFESAQEFAEALESSVAQAPIEAPAPEAPKARRFNWEPVIIGGLVLLLFFYLAVVLKR